MMAEELDWDTAEKHLNQIRGAYAELPVMSGVFGLSMLNKLYQRFTGGERTQKLYDEMVQVE